MLTFREQAPEAEAKPIPLPDVDSMMQAVGLIVQSCIDERLFERQFPEPVIEDENEEGKRKKQPSIPIKEHCSVTFGTVLLENGDLQHTRIGNVYAIGEDTTIEAGAQIGDGAIIGNFIPIGEGATLAEEVLVEHGASIGRLAILEKKAIVRIERSVGDEGWIGEGAELSYGSDLPPQDKIEPYTIRH